METEFAKLAAVIVTQATKELEAEKNPMYRPAILKRMHYNLELTKEAYNGVHNTQTTLSQLMGKVQLPTPIV